MAADPNTFAAVIAALRTVADERQGTAEGDHAKELLVRAEAGASEPYSPKHLNACETATAKLRAKLAARPIPQRKSSLSLRSPACAEACLQCHMECAILPGQVEWWEAETERVRARVGSVLNHDGITYAEPMGRA